MQTNRSHPFRTGLPRRFVVPVWNYIPARRVKMCEEVPVTYYQRKSDRNYVIIFKSTHSFRAGARGKKKKKERERERERKKRSERQRRKRRSKRREERVHLCDRIGVRIQPSKNILIIRDNFYIAQFSDLHELTGLYNKHD